jgi:hypothetical protein
MFRDIDLKKQKHLLLAIIFTMIAVPYSVSNVFLLFAVFFFIGGYLIWMLNNNKPGVGVILIALAVCIPTYLMEKEIEQLLGGIRWTSYALEFFAILVWFVKHKGLSCQSPFPKIVPVILLFSILSLIYPFNSFATIIRKILDWVLFVHVIFDICANDKIDLPDLYVSLSVIFFITGVYTIIDYFGHLGPYSLMFTNQELLNYQGYDIIVRAKGLLGNSLVLTGVCMAYNAIILIRFYITNRFDVIMAVFCLFVAALSISRTVFVITAFQYLFIILFCGRTHKSQMLFGIGLLVVIVAIIVETNLGEGVYGALSRRFTDSGIHDSHRSSAFSLAISVFRNNPFGVGLDNIPEFIKNSSYAGLNKDALTLDNTILTQIVAYGIFSPIALYFFFYYLFHIKCFSKNKIIRHSVFLICLTWIALGFSFRVEHYSTLNVLFFGVLGYLYMLKPAAENNYYVDA